MKITLMGTGTCIPIRNSPGLLVTIGKKNLAFDTGSGYLYNLKNINVNFTSIDYIFYTHIHQDHIADLPSFVWAYLNDFNKRESLQLFGPKGIKKHVKKLIDLTILNLSRKKKLPFDLKVKELENSKLNFRDFSVITKKLKHSPKLNSIGYRIETKNKSVVYSGDTAFCKEIIDLSKNADLLIIECAEAKHFEGHLNPEEVGGIASKANVKKVVLIHMYPDNLKNQKGVVKQIKKIFSGEVIIGEDFMEINV